MNKNTAQTIWILLLKKYFKNDPEIFERLVRIKFDKQGNIVKKGRACNYARKNFPNLIARFEENKKGE